MRDSDGRAPAAMVLFLAVIVSGAAVGAGALYSILYFMGAL